MKRAGFYIDGYNVYHAICETSVNHLKWCSYSAVAKALAGKGEEVAFVKYYSAVAEHYPNSAFRHKIYLNALRATGVKCRLANFKEKSQGCRACNASWVGHEEKESDVNLCIDLLDDAYQGLIDVAYIVSSDSDITPAVKRVRVRFPKIELVAVKIVDRGLSSAIKQACHRDVHLSRAVLRNSRLPERVQAGNKIVAWCPSQYKLP